MSVRQKTLTLSEPLSTEEFSTQPVEFVSPPKWHLGHTTWFFETFLLQQFLPDYKVFHSTFDFLFNSYYNAVGTRIPRDKRGTITRPTIDEVLAYREEIDLRMKSFLNTQDFQKNEEAKKLVEIGLNHEEQHQELLLMDIKYILFSNPLKPAYRKNTNRQEHDAISNERDWLVIEGGLREIGAGPSESFSFDNERPKHQYWLEPFEIQSGLVTNAEFLHFVENYGYQQFQYWHDEGWTWIKDHAISSPLYWVKQKDEWWEFTLSGLKPLDMNQPVRHVSFYEAAAFANWAGFRLPTEQEWEVASLYFRWGRRWEWTNSAYLPYPGFQAETGAVGEYNGKFMINQMVLRGASDFTATHHSRITYRNFFHAHERWPLTGIRLAK